jgi:translation elongation factor EF-Ts
MSEAAPQPKSTTRRAISRPIFQRTFAVNSEQAIRVIRNSYNRLMVSLYAIDVILRIIGREETVDEIESIVSQMIAECAEQLQQEKLRLEKLKADNGITETPTYTHPKEFVAKIASPQIAQFVELIRLLDQLMMVMDTLWLCQVISNKRCIEARYEWQQRLQRLANKIVTMERHAHQAAYAQGHGEEVRLARQESGLLDEPERISENEDSLVDDNESSPSSEKAGAQ